MIGIENFDPKPHYAPRPAPQGLTRGAQALIAVGALSLVASIGMGDFAVRGRGVVLVNLIYFTAICFGSSAWLAAQTLTLARWSRPLRRFAESMASFTPVLVLFWLLFYVTGGLNLYEWHTHPDVIWGHKAVWLQGPFMVGRVVLGLSVVALTTLVFLRSSLRPDLLAATQALGESAVPSWWQNITAGATDVQAEVDERHTKLQGLSPILGALYAIVLSFFAFDAIMSLAPHWYANMFGGWFFMSGFWSSMVWIAILAITFGGWLGVEKHLKPSVFHDHGKLVFGFTMFWGYTTYAQILPIWYGNMTEEIGFLLVRFNLEPWTYLSRVVGVMCFLIPFITLLSRGIKKMKGGFLIVLSILAVGIWLERFLVAVPSFWTEASLPLGPVELGITAGFFGLFLFWTSRYLSSVPALAVTDPYMNPHPDDVHAHAADLVAHH
ncbi:hypothetical protein L6R49_12280 [Myxococcota bacterium]|nr:hypothetical protein [Myxococcota bacterium]